MYRFFRFLLSEIAFPLDFGVMFLGKLIEAIMQNPNGMLHHRVIGMLLALQLNQQTLLKVAGSNPSRIKILNFYQYFFQFIDIGFNILTESKVIDDSFQVSSDVSVILDASYQLLTDDSLPIIQSEEVQLLN